MRSLCRLFMAAAAMWAFGGRVQAAPTTGQPASEEEVNVLMFGVLQFSESLRHTYQTTEARLARLARAVHTTESLVRRIDRQTLEAKQAEVQIREGIHHLQAQTADLKSSAQQAKGKVEQVQQEELELKMKLSGLESTLTSASPDNVKSLKDTVQKHSRLLKDLLDWTKKQREKIELQNQQLTELQKQNGS
ncbi:uncharacterized protein angptl8 [Alosa pseudoharengus]|uniref:uncharacterized protein angptl8 n=1 Tax=Alosa pseudoharengus TaxID=34774 RepID=UPI003F8C75F6